MCPLAEEKCVYEERYGVEVGGVIVLEREIKVVDVGGRMLLVYPWVLRNKTVKSKEGDCSWEWEEQVGDNVVMTWVEMAM